MTRLIIRPPTVGSGLNFDLRDILHVLGPRVCSSVWAIRDLNYISRDDRDIPALSAPEGAMVSGNDLIVGMSNLLQVIDGLFEAYENEAADQPWVSVRAVDSSWWEVMSQDSAVIDAICGGFDSVEEQGNESQRRE